MNRADSCAENTIVLIGGGGHCKSVIDTILRGRLFNEILVTDKSVPLGTKILEGRVIGTDEMLEGLRHQDIRNAFITIGSIKSAALRRKVAEYAAGMGFSFPTIIDSSATVSMDVNIGEGVYIGRSAMVNAGCIIDNMAIINTGVIIEHDCRIGTYTHIAVGAVLCGGVVVGNDSFIGANSTVIQGIKIGRNCVIGAGSTVLKDIPDNMTVYGVWGGTSH